MNPVQFFKCIAFFSLDRIIIFWNNLYDLRSLVGLPVWFYWTVLSNPGEHYIRFLVTRRRSRRSPMEKELETTKKTVKISRRTAKATLTRSGKLVANLIKGKRLKHEVREMLDKLRTNCNELVLKHEAFTARKDDDDEFEEEEAWLGEAQEHFMDIEYRAKV